jgi:hypothetical protein
MIGALTAGAAAGAAVWLLYGYSRMRLRHVHSLEKHANAFYNGAKPFLEDPDTPEDLLDFISFLNRKVASTTASRELWSIVARGGFASPLSKADRQRLKPVHDFLAARPELAEPFARMLRGALMAVSFAGSPYYGVPLRVWLSTVLSWDIAPVGSKSEGVVARYRSAKLDRDDCPTVAAVAA